MPKNRLFIGVSLALLLVFASALAFVAKGSGTASMAGGNPDLEVPAANMSLSSQWQAKPASGTTASLPWQNVRVNSDSSQEAQNEPFVAVDPSNSKHMVVGANNWLAGDGHFEVYAYVTFDAGRTWTASQPYVDRNSSRINAADPTVAFAANGDVYFAFVAMTPAQGAVAVSRSVDGGRTWSSQSWATGFTSGADKPALASIARAGGGIYLDGPYAPVLAQYVPQPKLEQTTIEQLGFFGDPSSRYTKLTHWIFLATFCLLITAEWVIRKAGGLV